MRLKKIIVFLMVFFAVYSFIAVDESFSDMLDMDGQVGLDVRRVNSDYITLSIFGKTADINTRELSENWGQFSNNVVDELETFTASIRESLGIEEPERDYSVFNLQQL